MTTTTATVAYFNPVMSQTANPILFSDMSTFVSIYDHDYLNGHTLSAGDAGTETHNVLSILLKESLASDREYSFGYIRNMNDSTGFMSALGNTDIFVMPDIENYALDDSWYSPYAQDILKEYVYDGGTMIMTGSSGAREVLFLNSTFGFNLGHLNWTGHISEGPDGRTWLKNEDAVAGTSLENAADSIGWLEDTDSIYASGIQNGTYTSYYGDVNDSVVGKIEYGSGNILFVGFDYFDAGFALDWGQGTHADGTHNDKPFTTDILPGLLDMAANIANPVDPEPEIDYSKWTLPGTERIAGRRIISRKIDTSGFSKETEYDAITGKGEYILKGTMKNDFISGNAKDNSLLGKAGDDYIRGGGGDDIIWGGKGNDVLLGRKGNDRILDAGGDDFIVLGAGEDRVYLGKGDNVIADFVQGEDTLIVKGGITWDGNVGTYAKGTVTLL